MLHLRASVLFVTLCGIKLPLPDSKEIWHMSMPGRRSHKIIPTVGTELGVLNRFQQSHC